MSETRDAYDALLSGYGPQGWWPSKRRDKRASSAERVAWEVVVGAVLVQHTSWSNVEKALDALIAARVTTMAALDEIDAERLATLIRQAGPPNVKARRLQAVARFFSGSYGGSVVRFLRGVGALAIAKKRREELLAVHGVGPETADVILLYAGGAPLFVVDAYARRVMRRHGWGDPDAPYDEVARWWTRRLPRDAAVYNEAHALIVRVAVDRCRARRADCDGCPLESFLPDSGPIGVGR